jgi:hypothetical protein
MGDMDWKPEDLNAEQRADMVSYYKKHMIYGLLMISIGVIIAIASFSSGNRGVLLYGLIIYGIYDFFKGLNGYITYR